VTAKIGRHFETPGEFRAWLEKHHGSETELLVVLSRRRTGKRCMTWQESVAEALCFGWIDGVRRSVDDERYTIRFTPRKKGSSWSAVNIRLIGQLEAAGKMMNPGRVAFAARRQGPEGAGYSYEQREASLDARRAREFRKNRAAWAFFASQPPGYRRKAAWWVISAKRAETGDRRLAKLIELSAARKRLA
jgi:uncharacterized protein YdeI (YjbR/CyaY-like superfamily)